MTGSPLVPDPDVDVVARVRGGDTQLFELLMRRHNQRLFRVARAVLGDDGEAEDVMQDAYVRAFASLHQFESRARFSTWLTRIAVNEAMARRRRRAENVPDPEEIMDDAQGPDEVAAAAELRGLLTDAIGKLAEPFRLVFVLRAVERLSVAEVAECLDVDEATVKTRYFRARATLKGLLARHAEAIAPSLYDFPLQRCDRVVAHVLQHLFR